MILQTYKIHLSDLKVTCSTTIYKNLSLLMRIQNRQYIIIPSTGYFDGSSTVKNRLIDTIDFQFDIQRNKYLPKQIQLELKLIYRTGKINQKIYPISLNEFHTLKKGVKSKQLKILQRLYSLQCTILAKTNGTDSPFFNHAPSPLERVKSQKRFEKVNSQIQIPQKRRYYESRSPDSLIKYTINQNIKLTRNSPTNNSQYFENSVHEQKDKSILRESFQLKDESSSFNQRNKQFISSRIAKSIEVHKYPIQSINAKGNNITQSGKLIALQSCLNQTKIQLQKQRQHSYRLEKQISNLKNKIQHLYHEKNIILKQKQQERQIFQTKDKDQKIRQRREMQNLKRKYESMLDQKQIQINKLSAQLKQIYNTSINNMNKANDYQFKAQEISSFLNSRISQLQSQLINKNNIINLKNSQINDLMRQDHIKRTKIQSLERENTQLKSVSNKHKQNYERILTQQSRNNPKESIYFKESKEQITTYNQSQTAQGEDLYQLIDIQTKTYHQMLSKLQNNIKNLQTYLKNAQNQHKKLSQELNQKNLIISNKHLQIYNLQRKIKFLQDDLFSQRKINYDLKSLLQQSNTTQSILRDKIEKDKKRMHTRSYSYGFQEPVKQTVKIKTTYRLIYEPQSSLVYVPPLKTSTFIKQNPQNQKYGVNFNKYQGTVYNNPEVSTRYYYKSPYSKYQNGYFGIPLDFGNSYDNLGHKIQKEIEDIRKQVEKVERQKQLQSKSRRSEYVAGSMDNNYRNEGSLLQKNKDDYIEQNFEDSYIDENGDYVKKKVKHVYKKN